MKHIEIKFPNGETWRIPAQVVAESRAAQFYDADGQPEAIEYALSDDELIAYLQYVMDWNAVRQAAKVEAVRGAYDYDSAFDEATFEVKGE